MDKMWKRLLIMTVMLLWTAVPCFTAAKAAEEFMPEGTAEEVMVKYEIEDPGLFEHAQEAYEYYAQSVLFGLDYTTYGTAAREHLSTSAGKVYDALKPIIKKIANGERASSVITFGKNGQDISVDPSDLDGLDIYYAMSALRLDLPFETYWFMGSMAELRSSDTITLYLDIAPPYHNGTMVRGEYHVTANTSKTGRASRAAANARSVVSQYAGKSDYEKLVGYARWISDRVSYDHKSADTEDYSSYDASAWMLINAFDGDSSTNLVCQGYAKAFQYLCDLSSFKNAKCYYITGIVTEGYHAWNIVSIDGKRYLVDVTAYDDGTGVYDDDYFMAGVRPQADGRYLLGWYNRFYLHDESEVEMLFGSSNLNLATSYYKEGTKPVLVNSISIKKSGDKVNGKTLNLYMGKTLSLSASVSPSGADSSIKWSSSNSKIAKVNASGKITPVKTGTVTITAAAKDGSGKKASVKVKVLQKVKKLKLNKTKLYLNGGEAYRFKATVSPSSSSNKTLKWKISGDTSGVSISSKGYLKTKKVRKKQTVTVTAVTTDGSSLKAQCKVSIRPYVTSVTLKKGKTKVTGKTIKTYRGDSFTLSSVNAPDAAYQSVTWKSSNTSIAKVSSKGVVTPLKNGTVKITATAKDDSGKKGSVNVKIVTRKMSKLTLPKTVTMTSGEKYTFKPSISPASTYDKSLKWKITGDVSGVSISSKGVLTTKAVNTKKTVKVYAYSKDGSNLKASCKVTIKPRLILAESVTISGPKGSDSSFANVAVGRSIQLTAEVLPAGANQEVRWYIGSEYEDFLTVSQDGTVTCIKDIPGSLIPAAVFAETKDGSEKRDFFKIYSWPAPSKFVFAADTPHLVDMSQTEKLILEIEKEPVNASGYYLWECSDPSVAVPYGYTRGGYQFLKPGTVTITVRTIDGSNLVAKHTLTVYDSTKQ